MDLQTRYLTAAGLDAAAIEKVADESEAIRRATASARPGDLVCYMTGRVQGGIEWLRDSEERARVAEAGAGEAGAASAADDPPSAAAGVEVPSAPAEGGA
jgi:hypothetical protein